MSRPAAMVRIALAVLLVGCGGKELTLGGSLSPRPVPRPGGLRAGLARVDITPPAGVGLTGNGPEGPAARGYRLRLYARVLVLEDPAGNRVAIVVADLPLGSALLHRCVARITAETDGIGVDRLVIAVTHTHAGPGHFLEGALYNEQGSAVVGYDGLMLDSLTARISRGVHRAVDDLRPARVAWGESRVWGVTRIRSLPALIRNIPLPVPPPDAPPLLLPEYRLVNPTFSMLRVDRVDPATGNYRPAGAFSIFAMHGTGNAPSNDLLDGDIHGIVERELERHIDRDLNGLAEFRLEPRALHLFANGAEGDVSPAWPPQSRCDTPTLAQTPALDGPFTRELWYWRPPTDSHLAHCRHAAREAITVLGAVVADEAIRLFDRLGGSLTDEFALKRSFVTLPLRDLAKSLGICKEPAVGMSTLVGADDSHSRMLGWRLLGPIPVGLAQGDPNPAAPGCQAQKRKLLDEFLGGVPNRLFVAGGLPAYAQVSVLLLGDHLVGAVPAEVTTTAGYRMQARMLAAAQQAGIPARAALILGLTNGYMEYVATREEYTAQYYEGGSTLYGPGEAEMFGEVLARLSKSVSAGDELPPSTAPVLKANVGKERKIVPRKPPTTAPVERVDATWCSGDTLYARVAFGAERDWVVPSGQDGEPRVRILRLEPSETVVAWDDDPALEIRLRDTRHRLAEWELRWSEPRGGRYRVEVGEARGAPVECGAPKAVP